MLLSFSRQASLRHSKKISKLSIDSITDLPLEKKTVWNYDNSQFGSNLSFQTRAANCTPFRHCVPQKILYPI